MATPLPKNYAEFTLDEVLAATGGTLQETPNASPRLDVKGVSTDTRTIEPGGVFVALRGETYDGHDHLVTAAGAGAKLALVERDVAAPHGLVIVKVPSTLTALGDLARAHTRRWRAGKASRRVVGITGSAGKTTTKVATTALLERFFPGAVARSDGNLNNRIGVPLVLLCLDARHDVCVVEMGMNRRGEIEELARIAEPDVGVVTLVASAHTELVGTIDDVAVEKGALFQALPPTNGIGIGNGDDARVRGELARAKPRAKYLYGRADDAAVRILDRTLDGLTRSELRLTCEGHGELAFVTGLLGEAGALACAAAVAVAALALGGAVDAAACQAAFGELGAESGRLSPRIYASGLAVLDDSYNANPASMASSIRAAAELAATTGRRLVLVLGEMRELGLEADAGHEAVGDVAAHSGATHLFAIGGAAVRMAARASGLAATFVERTEDAIPLVVREVRPRDLVLVKGSRSIGTERVTRALAEAHGERGGSGA